jgi:hypothetical protein
MKKKEDIPEVEIIKQEMSHIPDMIDREFDKDLKELNRGFMIVIGAVILIFFIVAICNI